MVPTIRPSCSANAPTRCSIASAVVGAEVRVAAARSARVGPLLRFAMQAPFLRRRVAPRVYCGQSLECGGSLIGHDYTCFSKRNVRRSYSHSDQGAAEVSNTRCRVTLPLSNGI